MIDTFIQVSKVECDFASFVALIEQWSQMPDFPSHWKQGAVGDGRIIAGRSNQTFDIQAVLENEDYRTHPIVKSFREIHKVIDPLITSYKEEFSIPLSFDNGWVLNRYHESQQYVNHYDWSPHEHRTVSIVVMANTCESGGELVFTEANMSIPAEEGNVVIFPSSFPYRHSSMPVESGIKYSLVSWLS
jgi:predicted 2-oxoglutarate/Fe(II)-dependent dioxygenase YbiX